MKKLPRLFFLLTSLLGCLSALGQEPSAAPAPPAPTADTATAPAQIDPAKEAEIRKLLELSGTVKMTNQMLDQMISSFRTRNSTISPEFWDRFEKEMDTKELVEKIIPVYDKYYTLEDLKAVNAFYESPAGQRVLASTPLVMHESMQIGQQWGRAVAMKLLDELKKEKQASAAAAAPSPSAGTTTAPAPTAPPAPGNP